MQLEVKWKKCSIKSFSAMKLNLKYELIMIKIIPFSLSDIKQQAISANMCTNNYSKSHQDVLRETGD